MTMKNHRGRGMLLMCFRPPSSDAASSVVDRPVKLLRSSSSNDQSDRRRSKSGRRCLAGAFRDVFLQKSTAKNFGSRNSKQSSSQLSNNLSSKSEKVINSTKKDESYKELSHHEEILRTNSNNSSIFSPSSSSIMASSSSSSSSISCNSRSASQRKHSSSLDLKQTNNIYKKSNKVNFDNSSWNNGSTTGICTIVCCLVALIFWGKIVATLICTTAWLFFVPRHHSHIQTVDLPPVNDIESEEYKKRVIMEGFLDRTKRPRVVLT